MNLKTAIGKTLNKNEFPAPLEKSDAEKSIACLKRTVLT